MRDDELQVLGSPQKDRKHTKWVYVITALVAIAIGAGGFLAFSSQQPEKIKTGKKMGDPTIVPELQNAVDSLLNVKLTEIGGHQGQVIVMEVQTGEVLAMVGLERNFEGKYQSCKNFGFQQELGTLMHSVSLLAVLETGKVKLSDSIFTGGGVWPVDKLEMKDHNWKRGGYGEITLDEALCFNSNVAISKTVAETFSNNHQQFFDLLDRMSFGQPESMEGIDGLKASSYSSPKDSDWANWKIWWSSIGYERKIAPIQMLTFYNAIANDGKMVKPTLKTGEVEIINPQIASKANIKLMQETLEHVVSRGLGKKAGTKIFQVAGKTGDSQVGEYDLGEEMYANEYQVGFCGYFPANAPRYSMIVSMNKWGIPASGGGMA
ncbi:MAG: penicillin-binding protein [Prevotella sp.]|nr:penicillin-binding protein [Prevotella sp.]